MRSGWILVVLAGLVAFGAPVGASTCAEDRVQLRGAFGQAAFTVEIADTNSERAQGLMHRPTMRAFQWACSLSLNVRSARCSGWKTP